ncbi:LPP20 family lipoprotein [Labilibacter marinus]|uniref:LPP20 family lipoprotein n=1 Tax=Labilibacter marinus TaxID=1477105 RepID=UPI0009501B30|nr:LPP20 family lipoprotein [Labilibacter marinus]
MRIAIVLLLATLLAACSGAKKQAELLEQTKPAWLKERPVNPDYYYGIGITSKVGSPTFYEDKAKDRALADISSQINSTIKSEAMFYQVEDKQGVHEYLQNRIKSTSAQYLEGYEYIEKWEDLSNVYVYYRLSKQKYKEVKAQRKSEAIKLALEDYVGGVELQEHGRHIAAIEHYAKAIDALSGYLNESTTAEVKGKVVNLALESSKRINEIIHSFRISSNTQNLSADNFFLINDDKQVTVTNCPVRLKYSGGYLVQDKIKTDDRGRLAMPNLPTSNGGKHTLRVSIDLVSLGRQVTRNLYVRKIIEQQKAAEIVVGK